MGDLKARIKAKFTKKPRSIASSTNSTSNLPQHQHHPDAITPTGEQPPTVHHPHPHPHPNHLSVSSRLTIERHTSYAGTQSTQNGSLTAASRRQSSTLESSAPIQEQGPGGVGGGGDSNSADDDVVGEIQGPGGRGIILSDREEVTAGSRQEQHLTIPGHGQEKEKAQEQQQPLPSSRAATNDTIEAQQTPSTAGTPAAPTPGTSAGSSTQFPNQQAPAPAAAPAAAASATATSRAAAAAAASAPTSSGSRDASSSQSIFNTNNNQPPFSSPSIATQAPGNPNVLPSGSLPGPNNTNTTTTTTTTNLDSIDEDNVITTAPSPPSQLSSPPSSASPAPQNGTTETIIPPVTSSPETRRHSAPPRRQSLIPEKQTALIHTLLAPSKADATDELAPISKNMVTRKIWVKRSPADSATLVTIHEDDLVDDVREIILRKYANSLGRQFDAPDLNIHIASRDQHQHSASSRKPPSTRILGPEEPMAQTLDKYYPGGQTVQEALMIEVVPSATPLPIPPNYLAAAVSADRASQEHRGRSTPRLSPSIAGHHQPYHDSQNPPSENAAGYFEGAHLPSHRADLGQLNSIGHQVPSPGASGREREARRRGERPHRMSRAQTSPTQPHLADGTTPNGAAAAANAPVSAGGPRSAGPRPSHSRTHSGVSEKPPGTPGQAVTTGPGGTTAGPGPGTNPSKVTTPPARVSSPRPKPRKIRKPKEEDLPPPLPAPPGNLTTSVPPINVLIVEDNLINLKLLEAFVKRLKVRWQTATNGKMAVDKWRKGGFHLVLMDIQLPVMTGLEATREIRRLEKANSIGVFTTSASSAPEAVSADIMPKDRITDLRKFKSPVIIVALTASSLQSDRHEALAAGCNDFLTKPVNFVWLERKVMEWGCMQALIDFAGWRQWKDISAEKEKNEAARKAADAKARAEKRNKKQATVDASD